MTSNGAHVSAVVSQPDSLLAPLPALTLVRSVEKLDAGLRSLDHCEQPRSCASRLPVTDTVVDRTKLPLWRYTPRQRLIPLVRWETTHLAAIQKAVRSPALDTYFSITANLGTHTCFMVMLPILFWCGFTNLGRGYTSFGLKGRHRSLTAKLGWYTSLRLVSSSAVLSKTCGACLGHCHLHSIALQCRTLQLSNMDFPRPTRPMQYQ